MKLNKRYAATAALLITMLPLAGCNRLKARDQLNKGIGAFKNGQYESAISHFQQSVKLDDSYEPAKLYLATAYSYQVVPGLETPENMNLANKAIDGFQRVLNKDPNDKVALQQIASIYRNVKRFKDAKDAELRVIGVDPNDSEAHYTIGVVDWSEAYKTATTVLAADGLKDSGDGNAKMSKGACQKIKEANQPLVDDALVHLNKAVDINPNYDDAMQYLNLVYRRQADFACGNPAMIKDSIAKAEDWSKRAMGTRKANEKKKEEKASHGAVVQ